MKFLNFFPILGDNFDLPGSGFSIRIPNTVSIAVIPERCPDCQVPRSLAGSAQDRARLPPDHAARARHLWRKARQISKSNLLSYGFFIKWFAYTELWWHVNAKSIPAVDSFQGFIMFGPVFRIRIRIHQIHMFLGPPESGSGLLLLDFLSLKNDVNVPAKSNK